MEPCPSRRKDMYAAGAAAVLFAVAVAVGHRVQERDGTLRLPWPPLYARWEPHAGPGTVPALLLAVLVALYGPALARRLGPRALAWCSFGGSLAWITSLALVDGWQRGVARRLTTKYEYLRSVGEVDDIGHTLAEFTGRILMDAPDNWPAHVAGHPPGALLTFVWLDRAGLSGGGWAGVLCLVTAASAAAAAVVTVRALAGLDTARRAAPFLVLAPAAVWMGTSADGYFTGVGAWAVALLALAATRGVRRPWLAALGSGLLFGWTVYLSYGLTLMAVVGVAVLVAARTASPLPWVLLGAVPPVLAFTLAGFWWWEGYVTLTERYYQGAAGVRPYAYYVWGNLAAQVVSVGLAAVAGLRRAAAGLRRPSPLVLLLAGAALAMLVADLSGMSKAETERIWLPFALWLLPAAALLPARGHRWWLGAQAAVALAVNHLLLTGW
ncbi:hypothetical protein V1J52_03210 [Streptomyces sp. TRM 70351]|uniref:hypothetical protein n=1 Tax=Streptomyces sp. TRM 70351 TaxID=3116552 RepID=UPI002E7B97EF|nr:hypothetical protein [Streptomyces sp. TRM 70351]MEE1927196.1 hypothetical protein [Streptomyces sp. TRM 70351]